ncbi:MAG: metallopeptidase [Candidatus Aenigmarchaeota archaeon]|nr:metallopeptidase [Candidatus Aenigmarchaeota archaeon]
MGIKYEPAPDIESVSKIIADKLSINHDFSRVRFIRSRGSKSRRTLARCHALPRIMQKALDVNAHYVIEVISENFDELGKEEKIKTIIHELMHIPKSMGGGFRHHDYVCRKNIDILYKRLNG